MFVKMGTIIKNSFPKSVFNKFSDIIGYLPQDIIWGKKFKETYNFLKESESWTQDQFIQYQLKNVQEIVKYAYENVPYYTTL